MLLARAVAYWSSALQVLRVVQPLRAEREGTGCSKHSFDTEAHCTGAAAPKCGTTGLEIPARYLKAKRVCRERCSPSFRCTGACFPSPTKCKCDVDAWAEQRAGYCCRVAAGAAGCPSNCSDETATFVGSGISGGVICESGCEDLPEGAGAVNEDLHIFVTMQDRAPCAPGSELRAYASWCVKDQCDRPIFATINFCTSKLSLDPRDVDEQVSAVVHELAHALGFSASLFRYFRHPDGTPRIARDPSDQDVFPGEVRWSCGRGSVVFPDPGGNRRHVDLSPAIARHMSERGFDDCRCPIGTSSLGPGCIVPQHGLRLPGCVVRLTTPAVLAEVRAHFGCASLPGAELENQDTSECAIVGSHWEQRVFTGEVMAPVTIGMMPYMSRVTLALFKDSGWYEVDFSKADTLTHGVHWGYKQGCDFALQKCVSGGNASSDRFFCTKQDLTACSLDRTRVVKCGLEKLDHPLPPVFAYLDSGQVGAVPEMDYCPFYSVLLSNRVCTDAAASMWVPYADENAMREVFGLRSRCLMSSLHEGSSFWPLPFPWLAPAAATSGFFAELHPVCYEVDCAAGGANYTVKIADPSGRSSVELGTCQAAGQALSGGGLEGVVTCAAPEELCQVVPAVHNHAIAAAPAVRSWHFQT